MKTQTIYVDACTSTGIAIGRRNTYATEQIVFGLAQLVQQYGAGSAVLMVLRPTDTTPYPAVTSQSGTELTWTVSATDTSVPGTGECELYWYVDGGLAKSVIFPLTIQRDIITEPIDEPPEPYQTWVDDLTDLGAETLQNAQAAAQSATAAEAAQGLAEDAKTAAETAQGKAETAQGKAETAQEKAETAQTAAEAAADRAEDALEEFTTPTASANTLEPDEEATASYANGHFTFGIPQGVPGDPGVTPDFSIGTVQTLQPTEQATASITGTAEHPVLNLGIPKGAQGDPATNLVQSVNGKTGAVVLDAGDIGYDGETTYPDASVGKELGTINSALSSLSAVTEIIDTASGAIASFPDGSGLPMRSLVAEINPVQDLHGQSSPWPAGGGVNKLDANYTESITLSKTFNFTTPLPAGDYVLSFVDSDTASTVASYQLGWYKDTSASFSYYAVSPSQKKQVIHATEPCSKIVLYSNKAYNESSGFTTVFTGLQLQSGETATAWTPYSNLCPISGWTGLQGQRTGTQQWDEVWEEGGIKSSDGQDNYSTSSWRTKNYIPIKPETSYFISSPTAEGQYIRARFYDINKNYIGYANGSGTNKTGTAFTTSIGAYYMRFAPQISSIPNHDISINYPSTDTSYHAYTGEAISVSFGRTVYGGSDEVVSGNGTSTMGMVDLGSLTWTKENNHFYSEVISNAKPAANNTIPANILSSAYKNVGAYYVTQEVTNCTIGLNNSKRLYVYDSAYTDAATFKTAMSGVQLVYELAEPTTFTHEGQSVDTLVGQNNVFVDTGDVSVTYQASIKGYIDKELGS